VPPSDNSNRMAYPDSLEAPRGLRQTGRGGEAVGEGSST
jgi:hypothetical protein